MRAAASGPLGLLGGSFDPVHAGHLQLASDAQTALGLEQLRFLPAGQPWQKGAVTPASDRVQMLTLALQGKPGWCLDTREIGRPGPSYSVDTLRQLRAEYGPERPLVWVLGFDQLRQLASWHRWGELATLAHIAYAMRAGSPASLDPALRNYVEQRRGVAADLRRRACGSFVEFAMRPVDCSSTQIRQWLAAGDLATAAQFLPEPVLAYIRTHHPYSPPHGK
ncbi:putative nicotinate-nucleotide adenylyltransferase [Burkholderiales bacterium]|nr:putative nicotinate-nucleotide adenylyltransferase [Burkholderiales bacterium]